MNHVFYKLANDAWVDVPEGQGYAGKVFDKEKFAELIVRECMSVVSKKCASPTAYEALAEHFGFE
jgi:hypothetical protein